MKQSLARDEDRQVSSQKKRRFACPSLERRQCDGNLERYVRSPLRTRKLRAGDLTKPSIFKYCMKLGPTNSLDGMLRIKGVELVRRLIGEVEKLHKRE